MGAGGGRSGPGGGEHKRRSSHSKEKGALPPPVDDFTPLDGKDLGREKWDTVKICTKMLLHVESESRR